MHYFILVIFLCLSVSGDIHGRRWKPMKNYNRRICNYYFCEYADDYPKKDMVNSITSHNFRSNSFDKTMDQDVVGRWYSGSYRKVCPSISLVVFPRQARNAQGDQKHIINFKDYYQPVQITECIGVIGSEGFFFLKDAKAKNESTICVQMFHTVLLFAHRPGLAPELDAFVFPSYCACKFAAVEEYQIIEQKEVEKLEKAGVKNATSVVAGILNKGGNATEEYEHPFMISKEDRDFISKYYDQKMTIVRSRLASAFVKSDNVSQLLEKQLDYNRGLNSHTTCLCQSEKKVIYPDTYMNIDKKVKTIFKSNGIIQPVEVSSCQEKQVGCEFFERDQRYITKCQQQYTEVKLLTLDEGLGIDLDTYMFPTACACMFIGNNSRCNQCIYLLMQYQQDYPLRSSRARTTRKTVKAKRYEAQIKLLFLKAHIMLILSLIIMQFDLT